MPDSTLGAGTEKNLWGAPWIINKLARKGILTDALVAAATDVDNLILRVYNALRVASTTNEIVGSEWRVLARAFEQYMKIGQRLGLFGVGASAQATYIAALLTVRGTAAATDLRFSFSTKITHPNYDATIEADPSIFGNYAYPTTA